MFACICRKIDSYSIVTGNLVSCIMVSYICVWRLCVGKEKLFGVMIEVTVGLQKVKLCIGGSVEKHTRLTWCTHIPQKVIFTFHSLCLVPILEQILQSIGIYRLDVAKKVVNMPLMNLLRYNNVVACSILLVTERVEYLSTAESLLLIESL